MQLVVVQFFSLIARTWSELWCFSPVIKQCFFEKSSPYEMQLLPNEDLELFDNI